MDSKFLEIVREWAGSMENADKVNFSFLGLQDMKTIINVPLRRDLLTAAASFWDPIRHVFVFNSQELCPTVEEFKVISGINVSDVPILPRFRLGYAAELVRLCGRAKDQTRQFINGSALDVMGIARYFESHVCKDDVVFMGHRRHALCLCIMTGFLLVSPTGIPSVRLIDVVSQFIERMDPIPMVVAETIDGLDRMSRGEVTAFGGSPLLLQTVAYPLEVFRPRDFAVRKVEVDFQSVEEWAAWLDNIHAEDIEWRPPHWDLYDMTWSVGRNNEVLLVGIDSMVAYYPCYIRRQYGLSATIPAAFKVKRLPAMNDKFLFSYRNQWASRLKRGPEVAFSIYLPEGYADFLKMEGSKRREVADTQREKKRQKRD